MAKFDPKAIAKQIRSAQNQIAKGLRSNEEQAVSDVLKLLQKFQREIRSTHSRSNFNVKFDRLWVGLILKVLTRCK